jgi:hypothetical protein
MQARKIEKAGTIDDLHVKQNQVQKDQEAKTWMFSRRNQQNYFKRQCQNEKRRIDSLPYEFIGLLRKIPKINAKWQKGLLQKSNRIHTCFRRRILDWHREFSPGQFMQIERNSHKARTLHHATYAIPCGKIARHTALLWRALDCYDKLYPKPSRKSIQFEPVVLPPSKFIHILMKDCPHPDFQKKQIKLRRSNPATHLKSVLFRADLTDFFLSIGNDQCNDENIHDGDTVGFSFSQKGGAKCGDLEMTIGHQLYDQNLQSRLFQWIVPIWEQPFEAWEDLFAAQENIEILSSILKCPIIAGNYYFTEMDEGNRRLLMIEYFREKTNEFLFLKGEKKVRKPMKMDFLTCYHQCRKKESIEERRKYFRTCFRTCFRRTLTFADSSEGEKAEIVEGHWGSQFEDNDESISWQGEDHRLQELIAENWRSNIFFSYVLRIREQLVIEEMSSKIGIMIDQWKGYILSFQVTENLNIAFFKTEGCLLGIKARNQQIDLQPRISAFLEETRRQLSKQAEIPPRHQITAIAELVRHARFVSQIEQTVFCEWLPLRIVPERNLWEERKTILQEADEDLRRNVEMNRASMDLERHDWQEWDSAEFRQRLNDFLEMVNFFLPSLYFRSDHQVENLRVEWVEEQWGKIVPQMKIRYFETCMPGVIQEISIGKDFPIDNLMSTLGSWNDFRVNGQPARNQILEENMLIEVTSRFPLNESEIMGRTFDPMNLQRIKELFQCTLLQNWEMTLPILNSQQFADELQAIYQDRELHSYPISDPESYRSTDQ